MVQFLQNAPVTRAIIVSSLILMALTSFKVVDPIDLFFDLKLILQNKEWYRLFTSVFYFGKFDLMTIIKIIGFGHFASLVESAVFSAKTGSFVVFLMFSSFFLYLSAAITNEMFFGSSLASICFYIFTKHFTRQSVHLLGFPFPIRASYVPFIYVVLALYRGGPRAMIPDVLGILIGHLYFYLHDVLAVRFGTNFLEPPTWFNKSLNEL